MAREKLETKLADIYRHEGLAPEDFPIWAIIHLIRKRDAYQLARVRRIVKKEMKRHWTGAREGPMNYAHRAACQAILTALKGRAR